MSLPNIENGYPQPGDMEKIKHQFIPSLKTIQEQLNELKNNPIPSSPMPRPNQCG